MGKTPNQFFMTVIAFALLVLIMSLVKFTYSLFDDTPSTPRDQPGAESKPRAEDKVSAVTACRKIVRSSAVFGSKADFNGWSRRFGYVRGALAVQEEVELMNGLGLMIPHTYFCTYQNGKAQLVWLRPGTD